MIMLNSNSQKQAHRIVSNSITPTWNELFSNKINDNSPHLIRILTKNDLYHHSTE